MWHEYPDLEPCIESLTRDIVERIRTRLQTQRLFTLAVSGGRSPIPLFERLAKAELEWARVRIRMVDERYVPPEHEDSNEGLVRRHLLTGSAAGADFRGLYARGATIAQAVDAANEDAQRIQLGILGMGDDGHTASLFPGASQLDAALAPDAASYLHVTPPQAAHERITLSLPALKACEHLVLYFSGPEKRELLSQAEKAISKQWPISYLAAEPGVPFDVYWHP